ncbi:MAG: indole-3-glycerol phosphate synthase TrpC [Prosthecochloris sp.]|nr:indole-3-glycerol phosphate synthase TrpC [Prosthecochloris sp.]
MGTYLTKILDVKVDEVSRLKQQAPDRRYRECEHDLSASRGMYAALSRGEGEPLRLIAEVKKASPSRGVLVEHFDPLELARRYADIGASAFSVLTDRDFFQGANDYLSTVSREFDLPVLRKDFIVDESQVYEARLIGADAILLIVAALDPLQLEEYIQLAHEIGLDVLVEVHDERELDTALERHARMVGVNNRDLRDFSVSLDTSLRLRSRMPEGIISVAESGLKRQADVLMMQEASFDAVLIGEGLLGDELQRFTWKQP